MGIHLESTAKTRDMHIVKNILFVLFGLIFVIQGLNKFFQFIPMPELTESQLEMMGHFGAIKWLMPLVGVAELIGGILCIVPRTRALGALVILPVMVGIALHHIVIEPSGLVIAFVLMGINLWMLIDSWPKYGPIFGKPTK